MAQIDAKSNIIPDPNKSYSLGPFSEKWTTMYVTYDVPADEELIKAISKYSPVTLDYKINAIFGHIDCKDYKIVHKLYCDNDPDKLAQYYAFLRARSIIFIEQMILLALIIIVGACILTFAGFSNMFNLLFIVGLVVGFILGLFVIKITQYYIRTLYPKGYYVYKHMNTANKKISPPN